MNKFNMSKAFSDKKFKFGGYATIVTVAVIAIMIVINLIVGSLGIKIDLTKDKVYSLDKKSYEIMSNIEDEINVYVMVETGKESELFSGISDIDFEQLMDEYQKGSKKINIIYKDPVLYPQFAKQYQKDNEISTGDIIVECVSGENEGRYKVIKYMELFNTKVDQYQRPSVESLAIEQRVTSALEFVTTKDQSLVYFIKGHNELPLSSEVTNQLEKENYQITEVNVLTEEIKADSNNIIVITTPKKDYTDEETEKILSFLEDGGRAVMLLDYSGSNLSNINKILERYGVKTQNGVIVEGSQSNRLQESPAFLLPIIADKQHDITKKLVSNDVPVVIPQAMGLEILEQKNRSTEITPLLVTSNKAYLKVNPDAQTVEKEMGDVDGPFNIALAIEEANYNESTPVVSKLLVVSNSYFASPNIQVGALGNLDFIMNSFNWLQDKQQGLYIKGKTVIPEKLTMSGLNSIALTGVFVILIPLIVIILGAVVYFRRRHL